MFAALRRSSAPCEFQRASAGNLIGGTVDGVEMPGKFLILVEDDGLVVTAIDETNNTAAIGPRQ